MAIKSNRFEQDFAKNRYYGATGLTTIPAFFANYVNFSGRSRRSEYWYITLWTFILYILFFTGLFTALTGTAYTLSTNSVEDIWSGIWVGAGFMIIIFIIFGLAVLLPSLALIIRRYRDAGIPWWVLLIQYAIVLFANMIWGYSSNQSALIGLVSGILTFVITLLPSRTPQQ